MKIFPAIDIKDKKCVRLVKGDFDKKTEYKMSPVEQARKYRVRDNRRIRYKDQRGLYKTDHYQVERDETGVEQVDTYHNKVKCKLCSHKWEYNSSTSTRVA